MTAKLPLALLGCNLCLTAQLLAFLGASGPQLCCAHTSNCSAGRILDMHRCLMLRRAGAPSCACTRTAMATCGPASGAAASACGAVRSAAWRANRCSAASHLSGKLRSLLNSDWFSVGMTCRLVPLLHRALCASANMERIGDPAG